VLATVVTLFISAKLPTRLSRFYDPAISDGYILVGVQEPGEKRPVIAEALQAAGPGQLKSIDQ
jgi:hypothetical protein